MNNLEQTHDYKEDQFDYIQQTLRSICMKCKKKKKKKIKILIRV